MTPSARRSFALAFSLFFVACFQYAFANAMQIRGAQPDLLMTFTIVGAMFCDMGGGAATGFFAGLFHASFASPPGGGFGALIVSRTLVGAGVGWMEDRVFRDQPLFTALCVAVGTLISEAIFFVAAPQPQTLHWAKMALLSALYNAVIALPMAAVLRRLTGQSSRLDDL